MPSSSSHRNDTLLPEPSEGREIVRYDPRASSNPVIPAERPQPQSEAPVRSPLPAKPKTSSGVSRLVSRLFGSVKNVSDISGSENTHHQTGDGNHARTAGDQNNVTQNAH